MKIPTQSNAQKTRKLYQQSFTSNLNLQKIKKTNSANFQIFELYNILTSRKKEKIDVLKYEKIVEKIKQNPLNSTQQALTEELLYMLEVFSNKNEIDQNIEKAQRLLSKYPFLLITKYYQIAFLNHQNNQEKNQKTEQELFLNFSQNNFILLYIIGYYYFYKNYQKALEITNLIHNPLLKWQLKFYIIRNMNFPQKIVGWMPQILFFLTTSILIFKNIYFSAAFIGIFLGVYRNQGKKYNLEYLTKMGQYYSFFGIASLAIILILAGIISILSYFFFPDFHNLLSN